jgi:hypothetical protein
LMKKIRPEVRGLCLLHILFVLMESAHG